MQFFYARDYGDQTEISVEEILDLVLIHPESTHHVWAEGMADWMDAREVPELASRLEILEQAEPELGRLYRHSMDGAFQSAAFAEEIAERVKANPQARHKVWQDEFMWWPDAQSVPEIAGFGPLPPVPGTEGQVDGYQLSCDGKNKGAKSAEEIIEIIRNYPTGVYRVWQVGMPDWQSPRDVDAIASLGLEEIIGAPDDSGWPWQFMMDGKTLPQRMPEEIAQVIRENPGKRHRVWQIGMEQWRSPWGLDAFADLDLGSDPEASGDLLWHYSRKGKSETFLTQEQVAERVNAHPEEKHKVWQLGMARWIDPYDLDRLAPLLNAREEESRDRPLLYCQNGKNSRYLTPEEIVLQLQKYPKATHKVWPHMEERWRKPWDVEELIALGVEPPEDDGDDRIWYYKSGRIQHQNWSAEQVAVSVMKRPDEEHLVWQFGWDRWEDPRVVQEISKMLPPEVR